MVACRNVRACMSWHHRPSSSTHHNQLSIRDQLSSALCSPLRRAPTSHDRHGLGCLTADRSSFLATVNSGAGGGDRAMLRVRSPAAAARPVLPRRAGYHSSSLRERAGLLRRKPHHIKKPLNAFMLFMKEMRSKVVDECTLKESAAINQILGRKVSCFLT